MVTVATVSESPTGGGGEEEARHGTTQEEVGDDEESDHGTVQEEVNRRNKKDKKRKKKKKVRLMSFSGQTDAERRELRGKFRRLNKDIEMDVPTVASSAAARASSGSRGDDERRGDEKMSDKILSGWRNENNLLGGDVRYTREAVLDSENVELITSKAAREAEKIIQIPRYDATALAQNLVKKGSTRTNGVSQFNWQGLGFQVGVCFSTVPSNCSFLYGPLDAEYKPKERKKVEREKKADGKEAEVVEDQLEIMEKKRKKDSDGNELSAVERHINVMTKTLLKRTKEETDNAKKRVKQYMTQLTEEGGIDDEEEVARKKKQFIEENSKVDAVKFLFNPSSFTQTVENISNFSFTVKEGIHLESKTKKRSWGVDIKARGLKEAEEFGVQPGPVVIARAQKRYTDMPPPKQAIVALSMKDWRDMCTAYSLEKSDLPHREKESTQTKAHSEGAEEVHLPQVSQDSYIPESATQNNTSSASVDASDVPQVSQESYVPRRGEKQAKKARRAFHL